MQIRLTYEQCEDFLRMSYELEKCIAMRDQDYRILRVLREKILLAELPVLATVEEG